MSVNFTTQRLTRSANVPDDASFTVCGWATQETLHSGGTSQVLAALQLAGSGLFLGDDGTTTNLVLVQDGGATLNVGAAFAVGREFFWAFSSSGVGIGQTSVYSMTRGNNSLTVTSSGGTRTAFVPSSLDIGDDSFSHPWKGRIWNVMAWDRQLTGTDLLRQAFRYKPIYSDVNVWYPLARAEDLFDHGPNRRDATVTGTPTTYNAFVPLRRPRRVATSTASGAVVGSGAVIFGQTGSITGAGALLGTAAITFGASGTETGTGSLADSAPITFGQTGTLTGAGALAGASALTFGQSGALTGAGSLSATTTLTFGQSGALTGAGALAGTAPFTFAASATADLPLGALAGTGAITFAASGTLAATGMLAGTISIVFGASGTADQPTPSAGGVGQAGGGGGSIDYQSHRPGKAKLRKQLDEILDSAEAAYRQLLKGPEPEAAAKIVKPFAEDKRDTVPPPEEVDWKALDRDATRTRRLIAMAAKLELQRKLDEDDDEFMLLH